MSASGDGRDSAWRRAAGVAIVYAVVAAAYIFVSSRWLGDLDVPASTHAAIEVGKGIGFVVVTAALLFVLVGRQHARMDQLRRTRFAYARRLADAQQRATSALVAASIAHDVKNHLTVIEGNAEFLRDGPLDADQREAVEDLQQGVKGLRALAVRLMERGRPDEEVAAPADLAEMSREVARMARFFSPRRQERIDVRANGPCPVSIGQRTLEPVVLDLVLNAFEAGGSHVELRVGKGNGRAVLDVVDDGPGIPSAIRERVFEPFFSTKPNGTGLGLATARRVVERHGGSIDVRDGETGGTCVRIQLPHSR